MGGGFVARQKVYRDNAVGGSLPCFQHLRAALEVRSEKCERQSKLDLQLEYLHLQNSDDNLEK